MTDSHTSPDRREGWGAKLFERRIPQALGLYLGGSWGLIQFAQWLQQRYDLAPALDHAVFVTCLSFVPSVLLLIWGHGRPGRQGWTKTERLAVPSNLALSAVLFLVVLGGGQADATTRTVTVTDEEGVQTQRKLPKQEHRHGLMTLGLANRSGDPAPDWLEDAVTACVALDLTQNLFFNMVAPVHSENLRARLRREGFPSGSGMPLALQLDVARDFHVHYFVSGSFTGTPDELSIDMMLYDVKTGKPVAEYRPEKAGLFTLADEVSRRLQNDLGISEARLETAEDLPVRELLTSSFEAFESLVRGLREAYYERDFAEARRLMDRATALDESFAMAHFLRSDLCRHTNDSACAIESLEAAMRYVYRFPEPLTFEVKNAYYLYKGDQDKRLALNRMRAEMFPGDVNAYLSLATIHRQNNRWSEAVAAYERALVAAPDTPHLYLDLGRTYVQAGQSEKAREYYEKFAEVAPDDVEKFAELGYFHESVGEYDLARSQYEKGLLLNPGSQRLRLDLGEAELHLGHWDVARQRYEEALAAAELPEDQARAHLRLEEYYGFRGRPSKVVEHMEARFTEQEGYAGELANLVRRIYGIHNYVLAGQEDKAREVLQDVEAKLEPPFDRITVFGHVRIALMLGDVDGAQARLDELNRLRLEMGDRVGGTRIFQQAVLARLAEEKGVFEDALAHYRKGYELAPATTGFLVEILRCQRRLGRLDEALKTRAEVLEIRSYDPGAHYEAALLHADLGQPDKAREHLEKALSVWSEAEPGFEKAQLARAKLDELTRSSSGSIRSPS